MKPSFVLGAETHQELVQLIKAHGALTISGASNETARGLLIAQLFDLDPKKTVVVVPDELRCEEVSKWLTFFDVACTILNTGDQGFSLESLPSFLSFFTSEYAEILLITERQWREGVPSLQEIEERKLQLTVGEIFEVTTLFENLLDRGYVHGEDLYLQPGEYRKIGDTLDIYPIQSEYPVKVLFEYDEIQSIQSAQLEDDQHTERNLVNLDVYPASWKEVKPLATQLTDEHQLVIDEVEIEPPTQVPSLVFTSFPESANHHVHLRYLSVLKFYTLSDFLNDVRDKLSQNWRLIAVTKRAQELKQIFEEERVPWTDSETTPGKLTIFDASSESVLPHSLQNPDFKLAMLTDREIFSLKKETRQRSIQKLALDFITSLQPGDYVVHMDHGIGRFEKVEQKTVDDVTREYLEIHYAGTDRLFIPIDQADKLSKHVHEEGEEPSLSKLGSVDWKRTVAQVKEETQKIAKELLRLYAERAKAKGFSYDGDTGQQKEFEAEFPYTETPGQLKAISDIKTDMENSRPMDRLVCGDVGFGKTEVALRAAFKAIQTGKQVAFVSPITILADQHYKTAMKRMGAFNVRIEMLSRFRKPAEQKKILEQLRKGDIDLIVGTHRLLQEDVQFFNLGLLIIDEEQRFGVKQKERLKEMRANVDILTLTATPIPRTLNLSLHKFRDITTITTPPPGRLPIITEVRKYSDALMRQAILSEFKRKGQIYVLHNRVETIDAFADKLRKLVPEATFVVSHGQLKPNELEQRVMAFKEGNYDVLVSSTIIENGIDLPRANTLIVNEAENFGLSQLYQLRGRVGRGAIQAYAYFLYHTQKLRDDAKKRLRAIVEASELGSGFQIAMRDLEIRGAGEILGASQSGHMKTVGMSQFLRLLKTSVAEMQSGKQERTEDFQVEINLPVEAYIPNFFIPEEQEKISVYQKLAGAEDEEILSEFEEDLEEEYGSLPRQVEGLFQVLRLKMACRSAGVVRVKTEGDEQRREITLTLAPHVTAKQIVPLLAKNDKWRVAGSSLRIAQRELGEQWFEALMRDVQALSSHASKAKK